MPKRRIAYHEISYEVAARVEARRAHEPTPMRSGQSTGPIRMWVCDRPKCGEVAWTYVAPHTPPICAGGALFSFRTSAPFDPSVHKAWTVV